MLNKINKLFRLRIFIVFASAIFLSGCATAGMMKENEQIRIQKVVVTKASPKMGTVNLAEAIRVKTVREASKYPQNGAAKIIKIKVENFHFKNPALALLTGDSNRMSAKGSVIDVATNKVDGTFDLGVQDSGMINGLIGAALAAGDKPSSVEQRLTTLLAHNIMANIYGTERAQKAASRTPSKSPKGNYPTSYKAIDLKYECDRGADVKDEDDVMDHNKRPAYCG